MQKFTPCLWFDHQAEEAARFYVSIFKESAITNITHYGKAAAEASGQPEGSVMTVSFRLEGQDFLALNGGPDFKISPAISFIANCEDQKEIDRLWEKLTEGGGAPMECGWLTDRFGVSWQIVPKTVMETLSEDDPEKMERVMRKLIQMTKLDLNVLTRAAKGEG